MPTKFTPEKGNLLAVDKGGAHFTPKIAEWAYLRPHLHLIFERSYRVDKAGSRGAQPFGASLHGRRGSGTLKVSPGTVRRDLSWRRVGCRGRWTSVTQKSGSNLIFLVSAEDSRLRSADLVSVSLPIG